MLKTKKVATRRVLAKRAHFSVRAIRNANPRKFRAHRVAGVLSRIFSL